MAIDGISVSLSGMTSPVKNDAVATLTASARTTLAGVATVATRVEFDLLFAPLSSSSGQGALKQIIASSADSSASDTNLYSVTFDAALFKNPGLYQVHAKGIVGASSPEVISNFVVALSSEILVTEVGPQTLDDAKTELVDHEARLEVLEGS